MTPYYQDKYVTLYCGDCREVLPQLSQRVELVLTDPPYPREFDHVWDAFVDDIPNCMTDNAFAVSFLGHYQLPRVLDCMSQNMEYYWCAQLPNNNQPILCGVDAKCCWKPCLIFRKGKARPERVFFDNFGLRVKCRSWQKSQSLHKWGQAESMMFEPIEAFCPQGGTILDPFAGGGTTLAMKANCVCAVDWHLGIADLDACDMREQLQCLQK